MAVLEFEHSGFEQTLIKHKGKLILVGVLALLGTVGFWGYRLYKEASQKAAAVDFVRAQTVADLKKVAESHPHQPAGGNAMVLAAQFLSDERPGEAIDMLKSFLEKYPDHPLRDLASWRIAEYFVLFGDTASAEKQYDAVSKANSPYSPFALLRLGDMKWAEGNTDKAREYYDMILHSNAMAGSPVHAAAQQRVDKALKAKAPELVEYKEEAPKLPGGPDNSEIKVPAFGDINNIVPNLNKPPPLPGGGDDRFAPGNETPAPIPSLTPTPAEGTKAPEGTPPAATSPPSPTTAPAQPPAPAPSPKSGAAGDKPAKGKEKKKEK